MLFFEYCAAFPGFDSDQIHASLAEIERGLSPARRKKILCGQRDFLKDFAGDLDGEAARRVADVIREVVC
jgi:hypothetical protein